MNVFNDVVYHENRLYTLQLQPLFLAYKLYLMALELRLRVLYVHAFI